MSTTFVRPARSRGGKKTNARDFILIAPVVFLLVSLFFYPLVGLLFQSLHLPGQLNFSEYHTALTEEPFLSSLRNTFIIGAEVTLVSLVLGVPTAVWISQRRPKTGKILMMLILVPLWISLLVRTFAWVLDLQPSGPIAWLLERMGAVGASSDLLYHHGAVVLGMTQVLIPFVILPVYASLRGINPALSAAARTLGASSWETFRYVTLPQISASISSGGLLVFVLSLGYFITPALLGGPDSFMVSNMIWQQANAVGDFPLAAALAIILLILTGVIVGVLGKFVPLASAFRTVETSHSINSPEAESRRGSKNLGDYVAGIPLMLVGAGTIALLCVPLLVMVPVAFTGDSFLRFPPSSFSLQWLEKFFSEEKWVNSTINSIVVATATASIAVVIGTMCSFGIVRGRKSIQHYMPAAVIAPLIVPPIVTGIAIFGVLQPLGLIDSHLGLVIAYLTITVPLVILIVGPGIGGIHRNLEAAAATLGANRFIVFVRVALPQIAGSLFAAWVFAFITAFDEIVLALFLSGESTETLPRAMWQEINHVLSPMIAAAAVVVIGCIGVLGLLFSIARKLTKGWR
jgi:putative spermidine/putrescine transport system permease protein